MPEPQNKGKTEQLRFSALPSHTSQPQAVSINWAKAWANAGLYNSTAPKNLRSPKPVGSYKSCSKAGDIATNFVPTITPDAAKANDNVLTTFDYVRSVPILQ